MPCFISFRHVSFTDYADRVEIIVYTDVTSIVTLRLSSIEPQTHRRSSLRRGLPWYEDLRFCFVSYTDYEQVELTPSNYHTFVIPGWLPCETKWFYFFGKIYDEICASTSPIIPHHNTYVPPPPPVHKSYQPLIGGPVSLSNGTNDAWHTKYLASYLPEGAKAVMLYVLPPSGVSYLRWCVRPLGSTFSYWSQNRAGCQFIVYCNLGEDNAIQIRAQQTTGWNFWLMGTFGGQSTFTDYSPNLIPSSAGIQTIDVSQYLPWPRPDIAYLYCGHNTINGYFALRAIDGYTPYFGLHVGQFAAIKLKEGKFQAGWNSPSNAGMFSLNLVGWQTKDYYITAEGTDVTPAPLNTWVNKPMSDPPVSPRLALLYYKDTLYSGQPWGYRTPSQTQFATGKDSRQMWPAAAPETNLVSLYRSQTSMSFRVLGYLT